MSGILSALCSHYYKLKVKVAKRDDRYKLLFDNLIKFDQNLKVSEVDEILESSFKVIEAYDRCQVTFEKMKEAEQKILHLMKRLGIRPRWYLTGEIPGELEYEVWYDLKDNVCIMKTRDLGNPDYIDDNDDDFDDDDFDDITSALDDDDYLPFTPQDEEETRRIIKEHHEYMKELGYASDD